MHAVAALPAIFARGLLMVAIAGLLFGLAARLFSYATGLFSGVMACDDRWQRRFRRHYQWHACAVALAVPAGVFQASWAVEDHVRPLLFG